MEYLITGAGGQLGYAAGVVFPEAQLLTRDNIDISNVDAVNSLPSNQHTVVINTSAYTDTKAAEREQAEAYAVNTLGPLYLAKKTAATNSLLVHFSTDYVFDGKAENYGEEDGVKPLNVYGLTKYAGEQAIRAYNPNHYIIRTSALFGPSKHSSQENFVTKRLEQMMNGSEIKMVDDQTTVPTYTLDIMNAVQQMIEEKVPSGTYHVVNGGGGATWYEFTEKIAEFTGHETAIHPVVTDVSQDVLLRPMHCVLRTDKLEQVGIVLPNWRDSLCRYIELLGKQ